MHKHLVKTFGAVVIMMGVASSANAQVFNQPVYVSPKHGTGSRLPSTTARGSTTSRANSTHTAGARRWGCRSSRSVPPRRRSAWAPVPAVRSRGAPMPRSTSFRRRLSLLG